MSYTPMIKQYINIKKQHKDSILFFRLGDFYEMFFEDAILASRLLKITLTGRKGGGDKRVPMCGIPYHAAREYIGILINDGYKVAVCEQVEDPDTTQKIVKREVVRVFTPGTLFESELLHEKTNNYIVTVVDIHERYGLALSDISTGQFMMTEFLKPHGVSGLVDELARINPSEIIVGKKMLKDNDFITLLKENAKTLSTLDDENFDFNSAVALIKQNYPDGFTETLLQKHITAVTAAGALLAFLQSTQRKTLEHMEAPKIYFPKEYMVLDACTRKNLELTKSIKDGSKKYTLLWVLDYTRTAMGGRLLKSYIEQPLVNIREIRRKQNAVKELVGNPLLLDSLSRAITNIYDLERLAGRVVFGTANARDLIALKRSLDLLPKVKTLLTDAHSELLKNIHSNIDILTDVKHLLESSLNDEPPVDLKNGGLIKKGYNSEIDYLREISRESKSLLAKMEVAEKERTGIKSLKIGFNRVFGYYIEVTNPNLPLVPDDYLRKQTLVNAERFITEELKTYEQTILSSKESLVNLEYDLFCHVREKVADTVQRIKITAKLIASLDILMSYAEVAVKNNYTCPQVNDNGSINIVDGRHPVIENTLDTGLFVPNDTVLDKDKNRLLLITGPNMAGKSTYMRQVSLIVLMAQIGGFVPAKSANIGIVDRIFTRVGASDNLAGGDSTFMVEMKECKSIVDSATSNSLIIMDEVGRGTSTYDGISIAGALIEYINTNIKAKTLFSTHYHELTDMDSHDGIVNYNVAVKEDNDNIFFLRKVMPGKADKSYGIHVAKLAGLPEEVLQKSNDILKELERNKGNTKSITPEYLSNVYCNKDPVSKEHSEIIGEIVAFDLVNMTPLEALNKIHELQSRLKRNL